MSAAHDSDMRPRAGADDPPERETSATGLPRGRAGGWEGPTYYGRPQLKAAPFNNLVVGGYIFLAGLSGGSAILAAASRAARGAAGEAVARRGRYLTMLAPTLGSALLVWDLHTPQRFYNMMRIAKRTSPMSIGTWILLSFTAFAGGATGAQLAADLVPARAGLFRRLAAAFTAPASVFGLGLSTYTAALLSATSTPLWAASPRTLAARFGSSSLAAAAAALSLGEGDRASRRALDRIAVLALATEGAASWMSHKAYREKGVEAALDSVPGRVEHWGVNVAGTAVPIALHAAAAVLPAGPARLLSRVASAAVLAGSAMLRVSIMAAGDVSARDPAISFRFSQPGNLPKDP